MSRTGDDSIAILEKTTGTLASVGGGFSTIAAGSALGPTVTAVCGAIGVSVPVAGWIVAGTAAAIIGVIALVKAVRAGKALRKDAVAKAKALGLDGAEQIPGYIVKVSGWSPEQRGAEMANLMAKSRKSKSIKNRGKYLLEMKLLVILDALDRQAAAGQAPPAAAPQVNPIKAGPAPSTSINFDSLAGPVALGSAIVLLFLGGVVLLTRGQS